MLALWNPPTLATWATHQFLKPTCPRPKQTRQISILPKVGTSAYNKLLNKNTFTIDYLDTLTSAFTLDHVTSAHWASSIYKSVLVSANTRAGRTAADICASVDPMEMVACDIVYMTDTHCHYGDFSVTNGSLVPSGASWDLFIKQGKEYCSISLVTFTSRTGDPNKREWLRECADKG